MEELKTTMDYVKRALETCPHTRNSDDDLYAEVIRLIRPHCLAMPLDAYLHTYKQNNLPSIETVGRLRRKLQEKYPELRAEKTVKDFRSEREETFRDFARCV